MAICDLTLATGGKAMVQAAYSSGKPAYGVGAGNATMVIDETADIAEAARNSRISKTSDFGSGCSADGNLLIEATIYERCSRSCQTRAAISRTHAKRRCLRRRCGMTTASARSRRCAVSAQRLGEKAGFSVPADRKFIMVEEEDIGTEHRFSGEKLSVVMALFRYRGFDQALQKVQQIYRGWRQGPLVRHLFVRRRPYPSAGARSRRSAA